MLSKENIIYRSAQLIKQVVSKMEKSKKSFYLNKLSSFLLTAIALFYFVSCSEHSVYLIPKENRESDKKTGERVDVRIRPIFTSGYQSEDREKYLFDFSSSFTAVEIYFHNRTPAEVQWSPDQTVLMYGVNKEFKALKEDDAFFYYKNSELEGGGNIVLLSKPYEQQKEDLENIKRFMIKPVSLVSGGEVSGLLLFKKVPLNDCENVQLIVGGIQVNQQEMSVKFPLECPKE